MNEFFKMLSSIHDIPDAGMDDPRLPPMIEETIKRYNEISGSTDIPDNDNLDDETKELLEGIDNPTVCMHLHSEIVFAGVNVADLGDEDLLQYVEVAIDNDRIRYHEATNRVFPVRLWSSPSAKVPATFLDMFRDLPEASRTSADERLQLRRISNACRLVVDESLGGPISPESHIEIQMTIAAMIVFYVERCGGHFPDMTDEEIYRTTRAVRDAMLRDIADIVRDDQN